MQDVLSETKREQKRLGNVPNKECEFSVSLETKILVCFRLDKRWLGRESENDNVKLKQGANTFFIFV